MCNTHYAQLCAGIRADDGTELRDPLRVVSYGDDAQCGLKGCTRRPKARGLCMYHYQRARKSGALEAKIERVSKYQCEPCIVKGCTGRPVSRFMCSKHAQQREAGIIDENGRQLRPLINRGRTPKDGPIYDGAGYVLVRPPADYTGPTRQGRVLEHRLVVAQKLGRPLQPHEVVHHIDGNRRNNDPSNLTLLTQRDHPPAHEHTEETVMEALAALRHNDPEAYGRLVQRL